MMDSVIIMGALVKLISVVVGRKSQNGCMRIYSTLLYIYINAPL